MVTVSPQVSIQVYEGERPLVKDCHFLGKFDLVDIPEGPRGSQKFKVTFAIDEDGILNVSAYHIGSGSIAQTMTIDSETNRLTEEDIKTMLRNAEEHAARDEQVWQRLSWCPLWCDTRVAWLCWCAGHEDLRVWEDKAKPGWHH